MSVIKSRKDYNRKSRTDYIDYMLRPIRESGEVVTYKLSKEEMENYFKSKNMTKTYKSKLTNNK